MQLILICLIASIILNISLSIYDYKFCKGKLSILNKITKFSNTRMHLLKLVDKGQVDINSDLFKCIMSACSYSIRALYVYKTHTKAIDNVDIMSEMLPYLTSENFNNELKSLSKDDRFMFIGALLNVLFIYHEGKFLEKAIMQITFLKITNCILKISSKIMKSQKSETQYAYTRTLRNFVPA